MHKTLKAHTASPAKSSLRAQQRAFDAFIDEYNFERPHESLDNAPPATVYQGSARPFPDREPTIEYPSEAEVRKVISNGRIKWRGHILYINSALNNERIAIWETDDGIFDFFYGPLRLGHFDERRPRLGLICPPPSNSRAHLKKARQRRKADQLQLRMGRPV